MLQLRRRGGQQSESEFLEHVQQQMRILSKHFKVAHISSFDLEGLEGETPSAILRHEVVAAAFEVVQKIGVGGVRLHQPICKICKADFACGPESKMKMCCPSTGVRAHHAVYLTDEQMENPHEGLVLLNLISVHVHDRKHKKIEAKWYDLDLQNRMVTYFFYAEGIKIILHALPFAQIEAFEASMVELRLNGNVRITQDTIPVVAAELFGVLKMMTTRILRRPSNPRILAAITWYVIVCERESPFVCERD